MNKKAIVSVLMVLLIASMYSTFLNVPTAQAQISVSFEIENVVWGTPGNNPITVSPGDVNVPLTIYVRNPSNYTLRGVRGTLNLSYPFKDYTSDSFTAAATGQPVEQGDVLNQTGDILPAGSFTLTFYLNIFSNATKGAYTYNLTITYLVEVNGFFVYGEPQKLEVTIRIYNRPPNIYSVNPAAATVNVLVGESINFTTKCGDPDNDSLTYEWRFNDVMVGNESYYIYTASESDLGSNTLELTVSDGNLTTTNTWTITVSRDVTTTLLVSDYYITVGLSNIINFTLKNNVWQGTVDVSYSVPNPLVIKGNNTWTFYNVTSDEILNISVVVYAPFAAMGNTFSTTLTVSYSDEYGNAYTDSFNIGLITRGYINIVVFDKEYLPNPAVSGQKVSISATILNKGNMQAYFANVTILPNPILTLISTSHSYIGDLDENSPVPFTVEAIVKSDTANGSYPVVIKLYYEDDQFNPHEMNITVIIDVIKISQTTTSNTQQITLLDMLYEGGWTLVIIGIAFVAIIVLYNRKMAKKVEELAKSPPER
ncbi:MAG: COG1361 S-layer family protein [Candidatus Asgardarchaeia archaeon]